MYTVALREVGLQHVDLQRYWNFFILFEVGLQLYVLVLSRLHDLVDPLPHFSFCVSSQVDTRPTKDGSEMSSKIQEDKNQEPEHLRVVRCYNLQSTLPTNARE